MKITRVSSIVYRQELKPSGPKPKFAGEGRNAFETLLVKVETDAGIIGWGERFRTGFGGGQIAAGDADRAGLLWRDPTDIAALMNMLIRRPWRRPRRVRRCTRCPGSTSRCGTFSARRRTCRFTNCSAAPCDKLPAYASLLKYADTDVVVRACEEALGRGYATSKCTRPGRDEITAAAKLLRRNNGGALMVDVNAPWTLQEALSDARRCASSAQMARGAGLAAGGFRAARSSRQPACRSRSAKTS